MEDLVCMRCDVDHLSICWIGKKLMVFKTSFV